ncbi:hypothetical protein KP509_16G068000 [Ceratopteris richardii]|uniref:Uncharacterized protein n=1 Tax=Ceratopteris richardii TaxID=49495 RepID=A0A8T2SZM0_CERRI|nr:hypothetical protein KP509_16G068000 [Ceratopteris richardii]
MISARALSICWGENPTYWRWTPWRGAMFEEVAYLDAVCWFDISGVFRQVLKPGNYRVSFRMQLYSSWGNTPITLSLEDTASAHPPHVSEVFFDGRTKFKRRRCIPPAQTLDPENVTPETNDGNQLDHAQDGIGIGEEGTDGDGSDDGHDHTADGLNGSDDHHSYENDDDGGGDGSGGSDNHNNEDDNECEDDEDSGDDGDVYDEKLLYIEEQHIHNDDNCENDDDEGADASGDSDKQDNDNDDKCEDNGDEDSTDDEDDDEDSNDDK